MNYKKIVNDSSIDESTSFKYAEVLYSTADLIFEKSDDLFVSYLLESKLSKIIAEDKLYFLLDKNSVSIKFVNNSNSFDISINDPLMSSGQKDVFLADIVEAIREAN